MGFYEDKRDKTVLPAFKKRGAAVTLRVSSGMVVNEATGKLETVGSGVDISTYGLMKNYTAREIDGTVIMRGDRKCLLAATDVARRGVVPETGMHLLVGGVLWRVINTGRLDPGGVAVFYTLQLRV